MSMRSLSLQFCVTQLLNNRVDEIRAMLFGWMAGRRVESKERVALKIGGTTACNCRELSGTVETCAIQVAGVGLSGG